ncbi:NAD-dependent epimerase/dehydratase family protein [Alteraurantiacibacter aquimixticola]|uniref:NAD-dependent epimerase/dehydratase family protein n=1 Tax=Alteraurantiacibacter aquimixticola TaxID=2489173 RepID=A0A4V4U8U4_9SPHN|nr:NAD(P)H-binding protein [Alteraurantiacibacter aquimixticola]TIX51387.1 NAD-dependent epimerase/dehydratase family protein [Alteraurantiacibacter aquimixticola]
MTIAITGATGFVGQAVLDEAGRRGLEVKALTRREQKAREGVEWVSGDLHDSTALSTLASGSKALLHIAGVVNAPDRAGFEHGNVTGTANVVSAARTAETERFVCVSSLSAREPGLSDYGLSKRMAEEKVEVSGLDWTIIRPPAIYGPRDTEILELFRAAKWGVVPMPPEGRASLIHVDDLARLLLDSALGTGRDWSQRIFEVDDARKGGWAHSELARAIGEAMGRNVFAPAVPAGLLKAAAQLDRMLRGEKAKLTPDRASYMVHPDWVSDPEKAVPEALWSARIDTREGLRETARWYAEQGWL